MLDPDLLGIMVEETVDTDAGSIFEEVLGRSLVSIRARVEQVDIAPLRDSGIQAIAEIRRSIPDPETRAVFARTGLDVASCQLLSNRIGKKLTAVNKLLAEPLALEKALELIVPDLLDVPQMATSYEFAGDFLGMALAWTTQQSMPEILDQYAPEASDLQRFYIFFSDIFGYRLPWGVGAYLQIARHIAGVSNDDTAMASWLPGMIRYGVATPAAAWAMTLGCPSRELAAKIAIGYSDDVFSEAPTYNRFVEWFAELSEEDFAYRFGAEALDAEVLTRRAAALVPANRELTALVRTQSRQFDFDVGGMEYEGRSVHLPDVRASSRVELRRDYANQYDVNAIEVFVSGEMLGYVPRSSARLIAPLMDAGADANARVLEAQRANGSRRVMLRVGLDGPA